MRGKKNITKVIQEFLKTSPRYKAQKRNGILPPEHRISLTKFPTDEQYIKNFIVHVECTYMYNFYGVPTVNQHKMYLHKKSFINPASVGLLRRKVVEINDPTVDKKTILFELIRLLNTDKHTILRYVELQEFLSKLTIHETKEYKKLIVYVYKWLLSMKHKFDTKSIHFEFCQEISDLIVRKIYESHQRKDNQILNAAEDELMTIEILEKAREEKRSQNFEAAKEHYETAYFRKIIDDVDRVQALEFICEQSKTDMDLKYLSRILGRVKQINLSKAHEKVLQRAIYQINERSNLQSEGSNMSAKTQIQKTIEQSLETKGQLAREQLLLENTIIDGQNAGTIPDGDNKIENGIDIRDGSKNS